jgi:eukaryotic-like serine/threonine-protein kinase
LGQFSGGIQRGLLNRLKQRGVPEGRFSAKIRCGRRRPHASGRAISMTDPKDKELATSEHVSPFFESEANPSSDHGSKENPPEKERAAVPRPVNNPNPTPEDRAAPGEAATQLEIGSPLIAASSKEVSGSEAHPAHPSDAPTQLEIATPFGGSRSGSSSESPTHLDVNLGGVNFISRPISGTGQAPTFAPGSVLGGRYEILGTVGEGGMGAVYKSYDRELGRMVALKVIRPELANNPDILQRFKQEILLASKVTDRNIIRIYDLGDADGVRFITMEYVEGEDLRGLLQRHGKISPAEAVEIMEQVVSGLQAAHRVGVIHRDLKPGNIMRDKEGRVLVMDFGLARSLGGDGMTRTGMMLGTMEYMSPEQAQAKEVDARSDIFTVGLILYELLTGVMPYRAESAIASLLKRTQQRAIPVSDIDRKVSGALSNIVSKCLERDPALRYQNANELLDDLRSWQGKGAKSKISASSSSLLLNRVRDLPWKPAVGAVLLIAVVVTVTLYTGARRGRVAVVPQHAPVSVLVADFQNNTSDTLFDETLEPMFNVALEGASFINTYNRGAALRAAAKLPNPSQKLDEPTSRLVAVREGVAAILTGSLSRRGNGYNLSVKAIDAFTGKTLATADADTASKDELLLEVPKLAAPIRTALGDTMPESVQLAATQGTFAASNVEAVHQYSIGMQQQSVGKWAEALQSFSKAAELDPNFARAYSGMAAAAGNLDQPQNAEKYVKLAMAHVDRLTERERYKVRGLYYIRTENWQKCVEEYSELMKQYPADSVGQSNLAFCYGRLLNMPKAKEEAQRGLEIAPKDLMARMNYSLYSCYAADFQSCERESREVLKLNPAYEEAFLVLAYAQIGQSQLSQAAETYQKLEKVSDWGASLAAAGLGDLALYQGRLREATQILEKGAATDLAAKKPDAAADKFVMLAYANLLRKDPRSVQTAAQSALANSQSTKIRFLAARALIEVGESAKARKLAAGLASGLQAAPQAYAKLLLGEAALKEHDARQAIQLFTEARDLTDTWIGRFDLGRAYLEAEAFTEADSEFDRCLKRRGEALELFMDDMPTYSYLPAVYYYQGRVREGLHSPSFADSYRTYLGIRDKASDDPLLTDIHHRLGQ